MSTNLSVPPEAGPSASGCPAHHAGPLEGTWLLRHPVLPLVRMVLFLFLSGPFKSVQTIVEEMVEPIETNTAVYDEPARLLAGYLPLLLQLDILKNRRQQPPGPIPTIVNEEHKPVGRISNVALWVCQQVLSQELEAINSLLCGPCGCALCCVGPDCASGGQEGPPTAMRQDFFEIPLTPEELALFDLPRTDSPQTRSCRANSEPSLCVSGRPFYEEGAAIYHWQNGWGLILPRRSICPQLDATALRCRIYPQRPAVCRRPQIFPYLLEKQPDSGPAGAADASPAYVARKKLLAIWDCPYVRKYRDEIAGFAEMSGLTPVFMANKA